jgi:CheY-like chemotaxis protein
MPDRAVPVVFRLRARAIEGEMHAFPERVPPGEYVVLEVEDRGMGMSQEVLAQALDPFFTTKDVGQGTGLGLPVAFGIVHGHQGYLTIDSRLGEGTRVRIYLPRLQETARAAPPTAARSMVLEPEAQVTRSILVIDDEQSVLDVVRRFLQIAGHSVIPANSGQAALDLLPTAPSVDLVILDLMIPREEGLANFRALREKLPGKPILLCTGLVQAEQANQLLKEGAADLLRKPFRMNELWHAVNRCIEHASQASESE